MQSSKLPTRLRKEPLIDALFEMRMEGSASLASFLPGLLRGGLDGGEALLPERTQAAGIPDPIRANEPQLKYAPLVSMAWGKFRILIGDNSVIVASQLPYPGWAEFRDAILSVLKVLVASKLVSKLERYSIKYVDLIPRMAIEEQVAALNWSIKIGDVQITKEITSLRTEISSKEFLNVVSIQTGAMITYQANGKTANGMLLDVDTIVRSEGLSLEEFMDSVVDRVNSLHEANKQMFFACLTPESIESLEPEYAA